MSNPRIKNGRFISRLRAYATLPSRQCFPPSLLPAIEKIAELLTLLNDFSKTNTESHIQTNFILFLVISSFMSHFFKKLQRKTCLQWIKRPLSN